MNDRPDWFAQVKSAAPQIADVAPSLGLVVRGRRWGPCPACNVDTPGHPPCTFRHGGIGWMCSRCKATGDAVTLAAIVLTGSRKPVGAQWAEVRAFFARRGDCDPDGVTVSTWVPPVRPPPVELAYPDLGDFLSLGGPVEEDPEVLAFWRSRGFGPRTAAAWALPEYATWPAWWGCGHARLWRLACPMYDAAGVVRSVHGRAVREPGTYMSGPRNGEKRAKTHAPGGVRGDSLLFADPWLGVWLLQGESVPTEVLIVEGITDYCACTSVTLPGVAVLGGISGSFRALGDVRFPPGCVIYIGTDNDEAGDKYAAEVRAAIGDRAECRRVQWGIKGMDASDIVQRGVSVRSRLDAAR